MELLFLPLGLKWGRGSNRFKITSVCDSPAMFKGMNPGAWLAIAGRYWWAWDRAAGKWGVHSECKSSGTESQGCALGKPLNSSLKCRPQRRWGCRGMMYRRGSTQHLAHASTQELITLVITITTAQLKSPLLSLNWQLTSSPLPKEHAPPRPPAP